MSKSFLLAGLTLLVCSLSAPGVTRAGNPAGKESGAGTGVIDVHGKEFAFMPNKLSAVRGHKTTVRFTNDGVLAHNFVIESLGVKTETIQPGQSTEVSFTPPKIGSFKIRCLVPGHMEAGMQAMIVVTSQ